MFPFGCVSGGGSGGECGGQCVRERTYDVNGSTFCCFDDLLKHESRCMEKKALELAGSGSQHVRVLARSKVPGSFDKNGCEIVFTPNLTWTAKRSHKRARLVKSPNCLQSVGADNPTGLEEWSLFSVTGLNRIKIELVSRLELFWHGDKMTSAFLQRLRNHQSVRKYYHEKKTLLNQFAGEHDHEFFNSYEEEDFGDEILIDRSLREFRDKKFDWDSFDGPNGELKGLHPVEKQNAVMSVMNYPQWSGTLYIHARAKDARTVFHAAMEQDVIAPLVKTGSKRKRGCDASESGMKRLLPTRQRSTRHGDAGLDQDDRAVRIATDDELRDGHMAQCLVRSAILPPLLSRKAKPCIDASAYIPKAMYCSPASDSCSEPSVCLCRYRIFNENAFVTMLVPTFLLMNVRLRLNKTGNIELVADYFKAVFGVTNVQSHSKSGGVRGFHFYFHCDPFLGTFCQHAMRDLLGAKNWNKVSAIIADPSKQKGSNLVNVTSLIERKKTTNDWIVDHTTVEASSYLDVLNGYACYLRMSDFGTGVNDMDTQFCKAPVIGTCIDFCQKYGHHAAPVPPSIHTQRKVASCKEPFDFLKKFDRSLGVLWSNQNAANAVFEVANPGRRSLFSTRGLSISNSIPGSLGMHKLNVMAVELTGTSLVAARYLKISFDVQFGPGGMGHRLVEEDVRKLEKDDGAPFVKSYCTGDFGTAMDSVLPVDYLESLGDGVKKALKKSGVLSSMFGADGDPTVFASLLMKVNEPVAKGALRKVQLPHLLMSDDKLREADARNVLLVRAIVPLDRTGSIVVVWPQGIDKPSRLVFIPFGTMLVLPMTVLTSDCAWFTPSGQAHAELVFAFFVGDRSQGEDDDEVEDKESGLCLPDGIKFTNNDYYYPKLSKCGLKGSTVRFVALSSPRASKMYPVGAMTEFFDLFKNLQ